MWRRSRRIASNASASRRSGGTTGSGRIDVAETGSRRAAPVTARTSLMCTNPATRRVPRCTTGNRDSPVRVASASSSAGDTSSVTVVTVADGRMASAAVRSCSASAPVIRACSSESSRPSVRACAPRPASSSAVYTVFTASAASTRQIRSTCRDAQRMNTSSGRVPTQNHSIGGPSQSTATSGPTRVRFFGTISPITVCANTTTISAHTNATGCAKESGRCTTSRTWVRTPASAGSAIAPSPSEHTVTPSCAPAIIKGICAIAASASRARFEKAACGSMTVRRAAISENSPATKNALPSNSNTTMRKLVIGGLRPGDPDLLDPAALDLDDREPPAVLVDRLALDRDVPQPGQDEPGQRLVRPLGQPEPGGLGQFVLAYHAVDEHRARCRGQRDGHLVGGRFQVVLVGDLPDQLLGQVLQGHQAVGTAVLVDDDGHLTLGRLQRFQDAVEVEALRDVYRFAGDHGHRVDRPAGRRYAEAVDDGHQPGDEVHCGLVDREPAVSGLPRGGQQVLHRARRGQR